MHSASQALYMLPELITVTTRKALPLSGLLVPMFEVSWSGQIGLELVLLLVNNSQFDLYLIMKLI